jgi:hypothetical protein
MVHVCACMHACGLLPLRDEPTSSRKLLHFMHPRTARHPSAPIQSMCTVHPQLSPPGQINHRTPLKPDCIASSRLKQQAPELLPCKGRPRTRPASLRLDVYLCQAIQDLHALRHFTSARRPIQVHARQWYRPAQGHSLHRGGGIRYWYWYRLCRRCTACMM